MLKYYIVIRINSSALQPHGWILQTYCWVKESRTKEHNLHHSICMRANTGQTLTSEVSAVQPLGRSVGILLRKGEREEDWLYFVSRSRCWVHVCAHFLKIHWDVRSDLCTFLCLCCDSVKGLLDKSVQQRAMKTEVGGGGMQVVHAILCFHPRAWQPTEEGRQANSCRQWIVMPLEIESCTSYRHTIEESVTSCHSCCSWQCPCAHVVPPGGLLFPVPSHTWLSIQLQGSCSLPSSHCLHLGQASLVQHWVNWIS